MPSVPVHGRRPPMRQRSVHSLCLALLLPALLVPGTARATRYAGEFLRIGVGARALGMGSAFVGLADDGPAAYWNPAGVATLSQRQVTAMHAEQFGSIVQYDFLSYVMPLGAAGKPRQALSVSLVRLGVSDIPDTRGVQIIDENGNGKFDYPEDLLVVDESRFVFDSDNDAALLFSYARDIHPGLSLGGNFKYIRQWLGDSLRSNGFGIDLGLLCVGRSGFSVGATLPDATTSRTLWNTGTSEVIAPSLRLGPAKKRGFNDRRHLLTGAVDIQLGLSDDERSS